MDHRATNDIQQHQTFTLADLEQFVAAADRMGCSSIGELAIVSFNLTNRATVMVVDFSEKGTDNA